MNSPKPRKLTDTELAKLLEDGGSPDAKPDFEKLLKKASKPKK